MTLHDMDVVRASVVARLAPKRIVQLITLSAVSLMPLPAIAAGVVGSWTCNEATQPSQTSSAVHYWFSANGRFVMTAGPESIHGAYIYSRDYLCVSYAGNYCFSGAPGAVTVTIQWLNATTFRGHDTQAPQGKGDNLCTRAP